MSFERKSLLAYSDNQERASIYNFDENNPSMPSKKRKSSKRKTGKKALRVTKGRVSLKVKGYSGNHSFSASQILPYIALSKVKLAAKKILSKSGKKKTRKSKRGKKRKK
jgi:hypothetical protein